jgi:hypothetical protein
VASTITCQCSPELTFIYGRCHLRLTCSQEAHCW